MPDNSRIEDLRRRVQKDPGSIAFAQLAEECRRAGDCKEAVAICRAGLAIHPGYLSARVTLGRALLEQNELEEAQTEFAYVLKSAAENLAAIRGLAETYHRRGKLPEALAQYRTALLLARNDPDLEQTVQQLAYEVEPPVETIDEGLSIGQMQDELAQAPPTAPSPAPVIAPAPPPPPVAPPVDLNAFMASAFADTAPASGPAAAPTSIFGEPALTFESPVVVAEPEPMFAAPASIFDAPAKTIEPEPVAAGSATTFPPPPSMADEPLEAFQPALVVLEPEPTFSTTAGTFEESPATFAPALVVFESEATFAARPPVAAEATQTSGLPPVAPLESEPAVVSSPGPVAVEPGAAFAMSAHEVSLPDELTAAPDSPHDSERARADRIVLALEQFLAAVHVPRAVRRA